MAVFVPGSVAPASPGRAGTGQAVVLTPNTDALRALERGDAARKLAAQRAEAARQKAQRDAAQQAIRDANLDLNTGRHFQDYVSNTLAPETYNGLQQDYLTNSGNLVAASLAAKKRIAGHNYEAQIGKKVDDLYDGKVKALAGDKRRDGVYATQQLLKNIQDANGGTLRPSQVNLDSFDAIDQDPYSYLAVPTVQQALGKAWQDNVSAEAKAGRPGQFSRSGTLSTNFFIPKKLGDGTFDIERDKDGTPKINYTPEAHQLLMQDPAYAMVVKRQQLEYAKQNPGAAPLNEIEAGKQLIAPYAHYKETERETYAKVPQPRASGKPKSTVLNAPVVDDFTVQGGSTDAAGPVIGWGAGAVNQTTQGFGSFAQLPQPAYTTATNPNGKPFELRNLRVRRLFLPDKDGVLRWQTNNDTPVIGVAQQGLAILRNPKTGEYKLPPADKDAADKQARELVAQGWVLGTGVSVAIPKNKKFATDYEATLRQLEQREQELVKAKAQTLNPYVAKSRDVLADEAKNIAAKGTEQVVIPYDAETAGAIDNQTNGSYRAFHQGQQQRTAKYKQAVPKQADATGGLYPKKAPAKPASKSTPPVSNTGGLY